MATGNISLPEELLAGVKSAADAEHRTVNEVIAVAVQQYLEDRSWMKLMAYGAERASSLGIDDADIDRLIAEARAERRFPGRRD